MTFFLCAHFLKISKFGAKDFCIFCRQSRLSILATSTTTPTTTPTTTTTVEVWCGELAGSAGLFSGAGAGLWPGVLAAARCPAHFSGAGARLWHGVLAVSRTFFYRIFLVPHIFSIGFSLSRTFFGRRGWALAWGTRRVPHIFL